MLYNYNRCNLGARPFMISCFSNVQYQFNTFFAKYGNWGLHTCSFRIKYGKKTLMSVFNRVVHGFHSKTTTPPASYKAIFSANATFNRSLRIFFPPLDNGFEWIPEGICCTRNFFSYSSNPNTLSWPGSQNIHHVIRYKSVP